MRQTGREKNIRCLFGFELFLKTACLSFFVPIINKMFYFCLWAAGYSYITKENAVEFILSPCVLVSLVLLVAGGRYIFRFEWCAVCHAIECGYRGRKLSFSELFFESIKRRKPQDQKRRQGFFCKKILVALVKKCTFLLVVEVFLYMVFLFVLIFLVVRTIPQGISGVFLFRLYERYYFFATIQLF